MPITVECSAGAHPSCYEVHVDAPGHRMPMLSLRCAATRPGKGDAVCSLVPMRHADTAISIGDGKSRLSVLCMQEEEILCLCARISMC